MFVLLDFMVIQLRKDVNHVTKAVKLALDHFKMNAQVVKKNISYKTMNVKNLVRKWSMKGNAYKNALKKLIQIGMIRNVISAISFATLAMMKQMPVLSVLKQLLNILIKNVWLNALKALIQKTIEPALLAIKLAKNVLEEKPIIVVLAMRIYIQL